MQKGAGLARNLDESQVWLKRAADQGHALAAWELAVIYEMGLAVVSDAALAMMYYKRAAIAGHVPAIERLLQIYRNGGLGESADATAAQIWNDRLKAILTNKVTPPAR